MWSLDTMDLKALQAELSRLEGITIVLRYGAIPLAERTQFAVKEVPRAVYIETISGSQMKLARSMMRRYCKDQTVFPLNMKF